MKFIANAMDLCHYDSANGKFIIDSEVNGALSIEDAALDSNGGDPEGVEFVFKVVYVDKGISYEFEEFIGSYSLVGSVVEITRVSTVQSSNADAAVVFSATPSSLRIYGVAGHDVLNKVVEKDNDSRLLNVGNEILDPDPDVTTSSTTRVVIDGNWVVTPVDLSSDLYVTPNILFNVTSGGAIALGAQYFVYWFDGSIWTLADRVLLDVLGGSGATSFNREIAAQGFKLLSTQKDASDNWTFRLEGQVQSATNTLTHQSCDMRYQEILS